MFSFTADAFDYDIVANICVNDIGKEVLYHDDFKFTKNNICPNTISWVCSKRKSKKCKMMASTKDVNGTIMMKLNGVEHTHGTDFN